MGLLDKMLHMGEGRQLKKLKVYAGPNHPHEAQSPVALQLDDTATR